MIFSDDKRFQRPMVPISDKRIMAQIMRPETPNHVGPGTYFSLNTEDQRNGWAPKTFSRRQPMAPPSPNPVIEMPVQSVIETSSPTRGDYYKSGTLSSNGLMASPKADYYKQSPGPGQYNIDMCTTFFPPSPSKAEALSMSRNIGTAEMLQKKTSSMGSSPKFGYISPHNHLRKEVLFQSTERNYANIGPGHYLLPLDQMIKKSHNVRTISKSNATNNQSSTTTTNNNNNNNNKIVKSKQEKIPTIQKIVDIRLSLGTPGSSFRIPEMDRPKTSGGLYDKRDYFNNNYSTSTSNNIKNTHKHTIIDLDELQK